jgi:hypothetical protein
MSGKMTPPREPAVEATPVAKPRRAWKKWPTAAMEGVKSRDEARPERRPKARRNCQYSAQRLVK